MQVDQNPFPMHAHVLELKNPKVLIRPSQAESTKGKNVIIGEGFWSTCIADITNRSSFMADCICL